MKIYEIGTGYTPIPAQVPAATESVVEELTKAFLALGQDVEILDIAAADRVPNTLPITEVKVPAWLVRSDVRLGVAHKVKRVVYSIALAMHLKSLLKMTNDKVILHFHNQYNMFFFLKLVPNALREKAILAYTNHNGIWSLPLENSKQIIRKRYFQEVTAMEQADVIFALNPRMKDSIAKYLGRDEGKIKLIANGVNTDIYHTIDDRKDIRSQYGLVGKKVILQAGSVNENKGQLRSLEMLAPLLKKDPDMVFAYAGGVVSEAYHETIIRQVEQWGLRDQVQYLGSVKPGQEMNEVYNLADVLIFFSEYEGFPLVCIEALAAGVPVGFCSEMDLDFGPGCIRKKPSELAQYLPKVLSEKNTYAVLCNAARQNALKNYTWPKIAEDYRHVFAQILEKKVCLQKN